MTRQKSLLIHVSVSRPILSNVIRRESNHPPHDTKKKKNPNQSQKKVPIAGKIDQQGGGKRFFWGEREGGGREGVEKEKGDICAPIICTDWSPRRNT